jgi:NAD(P)H-flavin reductase
MCKHNKDTYKPIMCDIVSISDLTPVEKLFKIKMPEGLDIAHKPGQFVQLSIWGFGEAPISIATSPTRNGYFELGVRNTGTLTAKMHSLQVGEQVGIRGPFGSFFDIENLKGKDLLLISGGCGLAPMRSFIQYCEDKPGEFGKVTILYGAKSPEDILFRSELDEWKKSDSFADCLVTVDNIYEGTCFDDNVGFITTLIPPLNIDVENTVAVIVGPPNMYKSVIKELKEKGLSEEQIIVSLERYMKCGVGKCGHCAIEHLYCCIDGPVFWLSEISELKGAI